MNCTEFDNVYNEIMAHVTTSSQIFWISMMAFSVVFSSLMLFSGEKLLRPSSAIIAGVLGIFIGYWITTQMGQVKCYIKLIVSGVFGIVLAAIASVVIKIGLFLLGGVAFGAVAHYLFDIIPVDVLPDLFAFQNRNGLYWIVVSVSGIIGSILALIFKEDFMRITTSMIGGSGISFSTYILFYELFDPPVEVHPGVFLAITVISSIIGFVVQTHFAKRKKKKETQSKKEIKKLIREARDEEEKF